MDDKFSGYLIYTTVDSGGDLIKDVCIASDDTELKNRLRSHRTKSVAETSKPDELHSFINSHQKIIEYTTIANKSSSFLGHVPGVVLASTIEDKLGTKLVNLRSRPTSNLYATKSLDANDILRAVLDFYRSTSHVPLVRNAIFAGLVSSFDNILASSVRLILTKGLRY